MTNVIDFEAYKKNKEIKHLLPKEEDPKPIKIAVSPEQLRKIALSLDQAHLSRIKSFKDSQELIPDYELSISVQTIDNIPVALVWHPMR